MILSTHKSSLGLKGIPDRNRTFKNADMWLEDKRALDGAEGLWRVHDSLYDVADFIERHPGGKFWLEITKGTDITEAFECHHISTKPNDVLKKYFVRQAISPRNSPFTFEDNGFYRTLKRSVREVLHTVPAGAADTTRIITDALLMGTFVFAILANTCWRFSLGAVSGVLLAWTAVAAHNYYHQKDSFRMYYCDIGLMKSREWRIIHVLSHHLYTNTVIDMQAYITEPMANIFPESKSMWLKYASWVYAPLLLWPTTFYFLFFIRMYQWVFLGYSKSVTRSDFLPLTLPLCMYVCCEQSFLATLGMWLYILSVHSTLLTLIAVASNHFHPEIFIDGDTPRPKNEMDWGINQLDTVSERHEVVKSPFLALITFGDHAIHHLFPTLDQRVIQYLYPVVKKTMEEFNLNIRMTSYPQMIEGFFKQLAKDKPNPNPPNLCKSKSVNSHT